MNTAPHEVRLSHELVERVPALDRRRSRNELRQLLTVVAQRKRVIAATMLSVILLATVFIWVTPPLYSSVAELLIDPRQKRTLESEIMPTGLGSSALGGDTLLLESQIEVLKSASIIKRLIDEEGLIADPEFVGSQLWPLTLVKDAVSSFAYGPRAFGLSPMSPYDKAVRTLNKRLKIDRKRNTYVIQVTVFSEHPEKAARLANRLVEIYLSENSSAAASSTVESAETLQGRLDQLRLTAEAADAKMEAYKRDSGLIGTQNLLVVEQQLRDMNEELSRARVEKEAALSRLRQVQVVRVSGAAPQPDAIALLESPVMAQLQVRMAEFESRQAELSATVLPRHPSYAEIRQSKAALQLQVDAEFKRIIDRFQAAYQAALGKERALESQLKALEGRTAQSNANLVRLRELETNAKASRTVYEAFLKRTKEAWEQVDLPHSTARLISRAYPASRPSYPNVPILLLASAALGLMIGLAMAWLMHLLQGTPASAQQRDAMQAGASAWQTTR